MNYDSMRYWWRGRLLEWFKRRDRAAEAYRQALACEPGNTRIEMRLAYLWAQQGEYARAEPLFRAAVEREPKRAELHFDLGFLYEHLRRPAEAAECFERAVALKQTLDRAWYGLGNVYAQLGEHEKSVAALLRASELQPMSGMIWMALGYAQHANHNPDGVKAAIYHLNRFDRHAGRKLARDTGRTDLLHLFNDLVT